MTPLSASRAATALAALCAGAGAVAAVVGWALLAGPAPVGDVGSLRQSPRAAAPRGPAPSPPVEIRGPGGFHAPLVPVAAAPDGVLELPESGRVGGWWALGAATGSAEGTTLIAGHVDTREEGIGAFAALLSLEPGAAIDVVAASGDVHHYMVTARRTYSQRSLPAALFTRDGPPRLALVTCTGAYDSAKGGYDSNLVVYATPAPEHVRAGAG
ncbi:class F sortase [Streptomyces sp. NPDC058864]